jgi:hypothetical protein
VERQAIRREINEQLTEDAYGDELYDERRNVAQRYYSQAVAAGDMWAAMEVYMFASYAYGIRVHDEIIMRVQP